MRYYVLGFRIPIERVSSETARVTAGYIRSGAFAHIQELDSWAGDLRSSAFLFSGWEKERLEGVSGGRAAGLLLKG